MAAILLIVLSACHSGNPTAPTNAAPITAYVANNGSDQNAGTMSAPWQTLRYAVGRLRAGDTLYLRDGTYTGAANTIDSELGVVPSGTSWSNPVTIAGYPGEVAIIRPPRSGNGHGIRLSRSAPQYVIVKDLMIDMGEQSASDGDSSPYGVYLSSGANHNRFINLEIKNAVNFGVVFSPNNGNSPFNEMINCFIHDNGMRGGSAGNGHGLYISTSDNLFDGNEIYNNQGYGLHLYDNAGPLNVARNIIRNNKIHDNGLHGGTAYGIVVSYGDGNQVYGNTIKNNPGGVLIYSGSSGALVQDNVISQNRPLQGIEIQYATGTIVRDNSVFDNETDIEDLGLGSLLTNNHQ
jgi:parallel beta-helix repeat protein